MIVEASSLPPAALAFESIAERFDERFGAWESVSAQRRAVRSVLARAFPRGARILELGGGTGEDALWLARQGYEVTLTDPSPSMVRIAAGKLRPLGLPAPRVAAAERLGELAREPGRLYDGAFSNFAALNCVLDLATVGRGLAPLVRPGGRAMLVIFGVYSPGEWIVQLLKRDWRAAMRRFSRHAVHARLGGREFFVRYHRRADVERAFAPWFRLESRRGIGVFVPPSAAEPWITRQPRLLAALERIDRIVGRPLATFGDHVLYTLVRTDVPSPEGVA